MARNNSKRTRSKNTNHAYVGRTVKRGTDRFRKFIKEYNKRAMRQRQLEGGEKRVE